MRQQSIEERMNNWNWGAFFFTWIWGLCNKTYISLLVLLPIANIIMPFYLGSNGTIMAWENGDWYDEESFLDYQKKWAKAGFIAMAITLVITAGLIYNTVKERQESVATANEIMEYILTDSEFKEIIGDDYKMNILGETSIGGEKISYSLILIKADTLYWVSAYYLDNEHIDKIEITSNKDEKIMIIFIN